MLNFDNQIISFRFLCGKAFQLLNQFSEIIVRLFKVSVVFRVLSVSAAVCSVQDNRIMRVNYQALALEKKM